MIADLSHGRGPPGESLYGLIKLEATAASDGGLARLLALGLLTPVLFLSLDLTFWPLAALAATLAAIAGWGLLAHHAEHHPSPWVSGMQRLIVLAGTLLAATGFGALFIWLLGPRWML